MAPSNPRREARAGVADPIQLAPRLVEKIWGGRRLERLLAVPLPPGKTIGEVWGVWDGLVVRNGPARGRLLKNVIQDDPRPWLGEAAASPDLPLLVKFLDARENLSVQVHPDDRQARALAGVPRGKCELWYVVDAEPGAAVFHGPRTALSREELQSAIANGTLVDHLERVPVAPGDVVLNPPGTIHAVGAGVVLYEVQQACDVTYRLYDWGRAGGGARALHVAEGCTVADRTPVGKHKIDPLPRRSSAADHLVLGACRHFLVERLTLGSSWQGELRPAFQIFTALRGSLRLRLTTSPVAVLLRAGESVLLPGGTGSYTLSPAAEGCQAIRVCVPDLLDDVVRPLRAQGFSTEHIVQLGGDSPGSDLRGVGDDPPEGNSRASGGRPGSG